MAIASALVLIVALGWFGYISTLFVAYHGATDLVTDSPLLPEGWETYRGDVWSIGYPKDYKIDERHGGISFLPTGADGSKIYLMVREEQKTLSALKIARNLEGYPDPTDLTIANYPATKYTIGNGHVEYFILKNNTLIEIISDDPQDETVSIMFATFAITSE